MPYNLTKVGQEAFTDAMAGVNVGVSGKAEAASPTVKALKYAGTGFKASMVGKMIFAGEAYGVILKELGLGKEVEIDKWNKTNEPGVTAITPAVEALFNVPPGGQAPFSYIALGEGVTEAYTATTMPVAEHKLAGLARALATLKTKYVENKVEYELEKIFKLSETVVKVIESVGVWNTIEPEKGTLQFLKSITKAELKVLNDELKVTVTVTGS